MSARQVPPAWPWAQPPSSAGHCASTQPLCRGHHLLSPGNSSQGSGGHSARACGLIGTLLPWSQQETPAQGGSALLQGCPGPAGLCQGRVWSSQPDHL